MSRPKLEVADIFRRHGAGWRAANEAHLSLAQRRVMTAIEICRTAALGGHVERCEDCAHTRIAYNSCRNRHCPKCQWPAAQAWLAAREAELLPVPYFHVVFTLPAAIGAIAYQNKAKVYGLLFTAAAETLTTIAADPKHLGADIGVTAVLHTWGQNLDHHPHVHCIVPGGGISPDGERWIACRPGFFLPVRVLSRLFRRLFLQGLEAMHAAGELSVLHRSQHAQRRGGVQGLPRSAAQAANGSSTPRRRSPARAGLGLSRALHPPRRDRQQPAARSRPTSHVSFRWKDYRAERPSPQQGHAPRTSASSCAASCSTSCPTGFHRIRHYGLFANGQRAQNLDRCRRALNVPSPQTNASSDDNSSTSSDHQPPPCPCCGGRMIGIETFDGPLSRPYHVRKRDGL